MGIRYDSLDGAVRASMVQEIQRDIANGSLYISKRLTGPGAQAWPDLLREASEQHDDTWLAAALRSRAYMATEEERRRPKGGFTTAQVPHTAADTLAEGEFNRFYARGLCAHLLASNGTQVEVYRGKEVENPRAESQAMIGARLPAQELLSDLRASPGVDTALRLPPGPNSGLTVRRV
jgi:hypothetical protein